MAGFNPITEACTNTTFRSRGNTMSGVPGNDLRWRRKRYPKRCAKLRTANSGFVSVDLTERIIALRSALVFLVFI
jgi:hypothetical protein